MTRSPVLWGILGTVAFYALVHGGLFNSQDLHRYFTNHPVEYGETLLFAVALAALILKVFEVAGQYTGLRQSPLKPLTRAAQSVEQQCQGFMEQLAQWPKHRQGEYYVRRLRMAVEHVRRQGSAQELGDELKYLADMDATRLHNSYALFRVILWAIPILGFLGTVIGITMALNGLDPKALDESMMHVTTGLGVKFDTTALALAMSMFLMFVHFFVERVESSLLDEVDAKVSADLAGCFVQTPAGPDGQVVAMRRMAEVMVQAADQLVTRQTQLWQASMNAAAERWTDMAGLAGDHLKKTLAEALTEGLRNHAQQLAAVEEAAAEHNRRHWAGVQQSLGQNVQALAALQAGMAKQADVLGRAVEASGEVTRLQDALNRNLTALAGASHFEQTVLGLAAAIHLLNARLAETPLAGSTIQLESPERRLEPPSTTRRTQAA